MKAIFVLDENDEANGTVHPLHDSCLELIELRGLKEEVANIADLYAGQKFTIADTDETQHDEHLCVVCGEPMKAGA